jgi:hypothetical protein
MGGPPVREATAINLEPSTTGLQNSPIIFKTALASDLRGYPTEEAGCTLLQYVDDLLTATNHWDCVNGTKLVLHLLGEAG